ncbi:penicillin acylase family protein [Rhodoferax saidenbachensis]|uniref:Penicillin acylase family protein n=1 Tax=Rhodoferax saidenbachensis TaxID=1484693 RepID=A0A1P8KFE4_9BURK|nr:penicillin acylase family protein [Rhodoferax saidenbachensis]
MKILLGLLLVLVLAVGGAATWYLNVKQPVRSGTVDLFKLTAPVSVQYDERGVPHIRTENEADMYRALGYVHAQDRLFQMEMVRRLAKGELAEILGPKLLDTDKLFRTLGIRQRAQEYVAKMDMESPASKALLAYLDGINQYQDTHRAPIEFDILGIPQQPFTPQDTVAVTGYLAYSFAAAFRTEPALTYIRDTLGPQYLKDFDIEWHPEGVLSAAPALALGKKDWEGLNRLAQASQEAMEAAGVPMFEGSNAWAISGKRTASGKPLLAGDPHIAFSAPAVWYEAHLSSPGFELYGHYQALNPVALLGHNTQFGWSLTMFQNDDVDLIAEKVNPANPKQVWYHNQWVDMTSRTEVIQVKGKSPVKLVLNRSPHGPIISDAFKDTFDEGKPIAMWWAFLETENPILDAFYELNRADTREKARNAAEKIHAPGLNVVWANAKGDIGWWAAGRLPIRPEGVNPTFILDGSKGEADKLGFYRFADNPQEENPSRGYIMSANHQPLPRSGVPVPGYYNLVDRAQRLDNVLRAPDRLWDSAAAQALQLDVNNGYAARILQEVMPVLYSVVTDPNEKSFLEPLAKWDGAYTRDSIAATLFTQFTYELAKAAMEDEMGEVQFKNLLRTRALDAALPLLVANADSPWWDNVDTKAKESRFETVRIAWVNTLKHLQGLYGNSLLEWSWGKTHTLTHGHPLGMQKPLDKLFNVGPFPVPGGRETPNNLSGPIGPAPWAVTYGPSTRRVIDFAEPTKALGINPVGQSGVLFDKHYDDQAERYAEGIYVPQYLDADDVKKHAESTLRLRPAH